jgi:hypothetical protein
VENSAIKISIVIITVLGGNQARSGYCGSAEPKMCIDDKNANRCARVKAIIKNYFPPGTLKAYSL